MTRASIHLPDDIADSVRMWAFSATCSALLYTHLTNKNLEWVSPLEIPTINKSDHPDLLQAKVWGCLAFVLYSNLQDTKKIPKFNCPGGLGFFLIQ